jgi:hypothetical protein
MGEQVAWHVELKVKPGALEALRALTGEMVEATRGRLESCATNGSSAQTAWSSASVSGMWTRLPRWRTYARSRGSSATDLWAWSTAHGSPSTGPRVQSCERSWTTLARRAWSPLVVSHARIARWHAPGTT